MQIVKNDTRKKMHGKLNTDKLNMKRDEINGYESSC